MDARVEVEDNRSYFRSRGMRSFRWLGQLTCRTSQLLSHLDGIIRRTGTLEHTCQRLCSRMAKPTMKHHETFHSVAVRKAPLSGSGLLNHILNPSKQTTLFFTSSSKTFEVLRGAKAEGLKARPHSARKGHHNFVWVSGAHVFESLSLITWVQKIVVGQCQRLPDLPSTLMGCKAHRHSPRENFYDAQWSRPPT